jgi:hypothetical protein
MQMIIELWLGFVGVVVGIKVSLTKAAGRSKRVARNPDPT